MDKQSSISVEHKNWEPLDYDPHNHAQKEHLRSQFEYVDELIRLYDLYNHFVVNCFANHNLFDESLRNGFRRILHKDVGTTTNTEMLARFCDYVLNDTHELLTSFRRADQAVESYLDKLAALFSYSPDHDLFTFVYRQYLATRLLENRSHSEEAERSMIAKMKLRAGPRFTSRLEGMLNDIASSRYMNTEFQTCISKNDYDAFRPNQELLDCPLLPIDVKVLTQGIWPLLRDRNVRPPRDFSVAASLFQTFFENHKTRKVLRWAWELGTVTLLVRDGQKRSILNGIICNTLQAFVLWLFNHYEHLTLQEICNLLQLESWIGIRLLHSLCCGKFKILSKSGHPSIVSTSDSFWVNTGFDFDKYSQKLIALPYPDLHERSALSKGTYSCSIPIKAFIVRIMKKEKTIRLSALIDRVMDSLERFRPELKIISSVIENLIENEYLSRDLQVPDILHYVP